MASVLNAVVLRRSNLSGKDTRNSVARNAPLCTSRPIRNATHIKCLPGKRLLRNSIKKRMGSTDGMCWNNVNRL